MYLYRFIQKFSSLNDRRLKEISEGGFFYAALLLTEGTGLLFGRRWAEYFMIITTSSLLPLEAYEIYKRPGFLRIILFLVNIALVTYLAREVRKGRRD